MELFSLLFGLFIIGLGFFIKKFPETMSSYSTMTSERKKNIDTLSIAAIYKKGFIIIGLTTIIGSLSFSWLELHIATMIALITPLPIGILILTLITQKYDYNKQSKLKKNTPVIIISIIIMLVTIGLLYGSTATKIEISDNSVKFTGQYGITIQTAQIEKVELLNNIPRIRNRTNGLGLGNILKGHFRLEEFGMCRLFLRLPNPPFLYIEFNNGRKILFNSEDSLYTKKAYREIKEYSQNSVLQNSCDN